ncbi:type VII secretion system-associated protein [Streptomyces sp. NPDC002491]
MTDLTHLNAQQLRAFLTHDVAAFLKALADIQADTDATPPVRALNSLLTKTTAETLKQNQVLAIGLLGDDPLVANGKGLVAGLTGAAQAIDKIFLAQQTLFRDIENNLGTTIDKLLANQNDSLTAIDGERFLEEFADVDSDLESQSGSNSSPSRS